MSTTPETDSGHLSGRSETPETASVLPASSNRPMDAAQFIEHIWEECHLMEAMKDCDDRKLLWLLLSTPQFHDWPMTGPISAIRDAIENRLYPEYDGDNVTFEEWGWNTPEGKLEYVK